MEWLKTFRCLSCQCLFPLVFKLLLVVRAGVGGVDLAFALLPGTKGGSLSTRLLWLVEGRLLQSLLCRAVWFSDTGGGNVWLV